MPKAAKPLVSIILPTYNEAAGINLFLAKLFQSLKIWANQAKTELSDLVEVIVVDDNSPDGTAAKVREFILVQPQVKLLVRTSDRGLGWSILAGIKSAKGQIILGMDADNNHDPAQINQLVKSLDRADLVVASRFIDQGDMTNKFRFYATLAFNYLLRMLGFPIWDNCSGFYAIKKNQLEKLGLEKIYFGYGDYHLRLVYLASKANYQILEIPTKYLPRLAGQSKSKLGQMAINYLKAAIKIKLTTPN
jgi:dolichol-phosphate mannosyltransferase